MHAERSSGSIQCIGPRLLGSLSSAKKMLRDFSRFGSLVFAKTTRSHLMAWTEITRPKYQRDELRYASDTTDEWALIEPHIPPPASCGRTRETSMREVVNSIFYIG
jgi:hypothetical protein